MPRTHFASGGRYPVLRAIAILYFVGAVVTAISGIALVVWFAIRGDPFNLIGGRLLLCVETFTASFFTAVAMLAVAELIKLFIDMERNTRATALAGSAAGSNDAGDGSSRLAWMEGDETAEGALLRGH